MKRILIIIISSAGLLSSLYPQGTIDSILLAIEKNNTALLALRKRIEAQKLENRTGILPRNPEVDFNYLWGSPVTIGNRTDLRVTQTFDFPTAYSYRSQIADVRNDQIELVYQKQLRSTLLEARLLCVDLEYGDNLIREYENRIQNAGMIASSYKAKYDEGETGIIEYNKAQMNLLNHQKEAEKNNIERNSILAELTALNGGIPFNFKGINYVSPEVPADFEKWYKMVEQTNPVLAWLRKEAEISSLNEKLVNASALPKITTGYMSEKVVGEQFQGITAGISIPLWENRNRSKYARANSIAVRSAVADSKVIFYNQLKNQHERAIKLQILVVDYRNSLETIDNTALLEKALRMGEIALAEYFLGLSINYESVNKLLESEWELNKVKAILFQYFR